MGALGVDGGPDLGDRAFWVGGPGRGDLLTERQLLIADLIDCQFVAMNVVRQLRADGVQQAGHGRDQQKRSDQDAGIKVQPQHERPDLWPQRDLRHRRRGVTGRRRSIDFTGGHLRVSVPSPRAALGAQPVLLVQ